MLADFVILSQDILSVPAEKIRRTAVEKTYVGGKLVYDASKSEL
jgi:predicted amidohydrolase YtcJ